MWREGSVFKCNDILTALWDTMVYTLYGLQDLVLQNITATANVSTVGAFA